MKVAAYKGGQTCIRAASQRDFQAGGVAIWHKGRSDVRRADGFLEWTFSGDREALQCRLPLVLAAGSRRKSNALQCGPTPVRRSMPKTFAAIHTRKIPATAAIMNTARTPVSFCGSFGRFITTCPNSQACLKLPSVCAPAAPVGAGCAREGLVMHDQSEHAKADRRASVRPHSVTLAPSGRALLKDQ